MTDSLRDELQRTLGGSYTIERELGGGGMSRVFVATDATLGRQVVVKVLPADMLAQLSIERFRREISIAARLQHPHIVPLLTAGEVDGLPYFTMPLVEGESLRARLAAQGELPIGEAVRILREVASALAYAHAHDVVHRDIKPDNVLLSGGSAMVTDFGVAKAVDAAATQVGRGITSVGVALGTPAYMAPEQASADPHLDRRADVYAWGVMAYEMLTGQSPFAGRTPQAMLAAHISETPENVGQRRPGLPAVLAGLIMRCLQKRPADRPQSAEELVRALDAVPSSGSGMSPVSGRTTAGAGRGRTIVVAAAAVVVLAAGGWWFANRRQGTSGRATTAASADTMSLAVLPIENMGGDSAKQYLADGLTGELAGDLRQTHGLEVAGDISTFRFKNSQLSPNQIAKELGVHLLLTGRLQSEGERIRLQMQLSDADGKLLWSKRYDRKNTDNFALEDEITRSVASELRLVLSPKTVAATRAGRTENPQAHDLYLRGKFEQNKLSAQGLTNAVSFFKQALAIDSNYAQAAVGLGTAYAMQADAYLPSHPLHVLAKAAAKRALDADSMLAEAHVLYGAQVAAADWKLRAGIAEMRRGVALDPNSPVALLNYATFMAITGNDSEAVRVARRVLEIDPLAAQASMVAAVALALRGRPAEALHWDSVTKKLDPSVVYFDAWDGLALRELGKLDESVKAYQTFQSLIGMPAFGLAMTYAKMGKRAEALGIVHQLERLRRKQFVDPCTIAAVYASLGDRDHAMQWLEQAFRAKDWPLRFLLNFDSPYLRDLDGDPRFIALRKKVLATTFTD